MVLSTEDGRIIFYATQARSTTSTATSPDDSAAAKAALLPSCRPLGQLVGRDDEAGSGTTRASRIKDFDILPVHTSETGTVTIVVVAGSSDGAVRVWSLDPARLLARVPVPGPGQDLNLPASPAELGTLLGTYQTGNRITCLTAFVMLRQEDGDGSGRGEEASDQEEDQDRSDGDSGGDGL